MNSSYEEALIKLMVGHLEEEGWRKEANCPPGWKARPSSNDTTGVEMEFLSPSMEFFPGILEMLTYSKQVSNDSEDLDNLVDASNTIDNILDDPKSMDAMENDLNMLSRDTLESSSTSKPKKQALLPKSIENKRSTSSSSPSSSSSSSSSSSYSPSSSSSSSSPPTTLEKRKALASSASSKKPRMEPNVKKPTVPSPKKPSTKSGFEITKAKVLDPITSEKLSLSVKATPLASSPTLPRVDSSLQITKVHKFFSKLHLYLYLYLYCTCICFFMCI